MSDIQSFKDKLNTAHEWPSLYTFKFIVPKGKENEVKALFVNHEVTEKKSRNGNYISVTAKIMADSSETVVDYYVKANEIEGIIAL